VRRLVTGGISFARRARCWRHDMAELLYGKLAYSLIPTYDVKRWRLADSHYGFIVLA
jgi:hypothetical protein